MRGELAPGVHGRLVYAAERNLRLAERARGAVLLPIDGPPTPPAASATPTGTSSTSSATGSPCSGACARRGFYREEQEDLIERALDFARVRLGL